jgi:DNA-binding response OmpR family regulator
MRVLVVEDEPKIAAFIKRGLEENAYSVDVVHDGRQGLEWATRSQYDIMILDILLPELDGVQLCRELRRDRQNVLILMLTAKDAVPDRVAGLDAGADDYLVKPFAFRELLARLRALRRRNTELRSHALQIGDLKLDLVTRQAERQGQVIELTAREFELLALLMQHPKQVFSRTVIAEQVWDDTFLHDTNVVDVYISYLRRKIDDPFSDKMIQTVHGMGYRIAAPEKNEAGNP